MRKTILSLIVPLALLGCNPAFEDDLAVEDGGDVADAATSGDADLKADNLSLPFTVFEDDVGSHGSQEVRRMFTTAASYRRYFGHDAPGVNFAKQWVVFYSAGVQRSGGYKASIDSIRTSSSGLTLKVVTSLSSPGPSCAVTMALTKPSVLVKFNIPSPRPGYVRYYKNDKVVDCPRPGSCESDADCSAVPYYCSSCDCLALGPGEQLPICEGPRVSCLSNPCLRKQAVCKLGRCVVEPVPRSECASDADCRVEADYCTGCDCRALATSEQLPICEGPGVRCFVDPCGGKKAMCKLGQCVAEDASPACNPSQEWNRKYLSQDPRECAAMLFNCGPGTTIFFNDCGCGCEQPSTCPKYFNCMPGPGVPACDTEALKASCPLSDIIY